ncbi:divergent CRAL/TRIO domain-containing protein [Syncephalis plumigaleata]|nr:divergent CRAL/TRIO domain-containing protein [Syncephalis plumigaleata]
MSSWTRALSFGGEAEQEGVKQSSIPTTSNSGGNAVSISGDGARSSVNKDDDVVFPDNLEDEQILETFVNTHVIYQAGNDYEGRPMIVFFACNLPDPQRADYDLLLTQILSRLDHFVENDYTVVLFSGGARYRPGWSWLFKAYNQLGRKYKKNLKRLYVVHPSIWVRLLMDMMKAVISPKFARKLSYVSTLSELATHIPLKKMQLPAAVLSYNLNYEASITYPKSKPHHGPDGSRGYPIVVLECVELLRERALHKDGIFRRSACATSLRSVRDAYDQGEAVNLRDYDDYMIAVLLKSFFHELSPPLFPVDKYEAIRQIPVHESVDTQILYIQSILLATMPRPAYLLTRYVFGLLHQMSLNSESNLMNDNNLAMVWAPNLVHGPNPLEDMQLFYNSGQQGCVGLFIKLALSHYNKMFEVDEVEVVPRPFTTALLQLQDDEDDDITPNMPSSYRHSMRANVNRRRTELRQRRVQSVLHVDPSDIDPQHELRKAPSSPSMAIPAGSRKRPVSFAAEFGPMSMPSNAAELRRGLPPLAQRNNESNDNHDSSTSSVTSPLRQMHSPIIDSSND